VPWFPHERLGGGFMPTLNVKVRRGDSSSPKIKCIVDTGAAFTFVARTVVAPVIKDLLSAKEEYTGAKGANGAPLYGIPVEFNILLVGVPGFPEVKERVWVVRDLAWPLLGQTWLEKVGAHFQNFPSGPGGRRFALYGCPWPGPP